MGGLAFKLPVTFFCMLIASISLAGFPFLAGFYSKEIIFFVYVSFHYEVNSGRVSQPVTHFHKITSIIT
jgi:NADH-quinone oxidoreductase subunit L